MTGVVKSRRRAWPQAKTGGHERSRSPGALGSSGPAHELPSRMELATKIASIHDRRSPSMIRKLIGAIAASLLTLTAHAQETPIKFQLDWRFERSRVCRASVPRLSSPIRPALMRPATCLSALTSSAVSTSKTSRRTSRKWIGPTTINVR